MKAMAFFHRTTRPAADAILAGGFRDASGDYMTKRRHTGVWLSDVPVDCNEGAIGDVLLLIVMALSQAEQDQYEWVENGKQFREWLFPSQLINERAKSIDVTAIDEETLFHRITELQAKIASAATRGE